MVALAWGRRAAKVTFRSATIAFACGLANLVSFTRGIWATELSFWHAATGLVEVVTGGAADIGIPADVSFAPNFALARATLHRRVEALTRALIRDHAAEALDGFSGQLLADLGEGAGADNRGLGFDLGGFHDFVADEALVGFVGDRSFGDLTAQAHGALAHFAHHALLRLEESAQCVALVVVEVAEKVLRVELALRLEALAFSGTEVSALTLGRARLAASGIVTADGTIARLAALGFAALIITRAEVATRRTLTFGRAIIAGPIIAGAFLPGCILPRALIAAAFLCRAGIGQSYERQPAQR